MLLVLHLPPGVLETLPVPPVLSESVVSVRIPIALGACDKCVQSGYRRTTPNVRLPLSMLPVVPVGVVNGA